MDKLLERSHELKQALLNFVLEAEGNLAAALETYVAKHSRREHAHNAQQDLVIDSFLSEGKVGDCTLIELFLGSYPDLSQSDRQILQSWHRSFVGLFAITKIFPDEFELMNWLTAKHYLVKPDNLRFLEEMRRYKEGEILLTRIAPVTEKYWTFSGPCTPLGRLGKPKLAVAIGNFKDNYRSHLYSDAPDLLAEAWESVAQYHHQFVNFFGSDEVTMPGYQLNKKIAQFQEILTQQRLKAAGIDENKTLAEIAEEAGIEQEEIAVALQEAGANAPAQLFNDKSTTKMVMPKVDLPAELKKAEQVSAISHPLWGQIFLPTYSRFRAILEAEDWQSVDNAEKLVRNYLEDSKINTFIWQKLAQQYPSQLEAVLQTVLQRPAFQIECDLNGLLQEYDKLLDPELPEIASVPVHLHNLFEEAVLEVNKSKPKSKTKKKASFGFQKS